ncbi:hypothetical protein [Streptomyces sp. NPDC001492]
MSSLTQKAVVGRRIEFTRYSDLKLSDSPKKPGVITGLKPEQGASVRIRLDGRRSTFYTRPDFEGLTYLDDVGPVPALPMGRFHPTLDDLEGEWEGVPICSLGEDGQLIALTADREAATNAMNAYQLDVSGCLYNPAFDMVAADRLEAHWAYFEWQPEDAECPWFVHWTHEGDDQAVHLYYLPA